MRIQTLIIPSVLLLLITPRADADVHCENYVCVDVSTDSSTGKITIHATKNKPGSSASPQPKSTTPKPTTPQPKRSHRPKPAVHATPKAKPSAKPTTGYKSAPRKKRVAPIAPIAANEEGISLSDQLTQLIPSSAIAVTPITGAVTELPTYFATTAPAIFTTESSILGITVGIALKPIYHWNFGDGQSVELATPTTVSHIYKKVGRFTPSLVISWGGTWNTNGFTYQVLGGAIVQQYSLTLDVHQGPTQYKR